MRYKFRDRVRVLAPKSKILRPDGHVSQGEFFEGAIGIVIRFDADKEGYLLVMECPELSALMGENITAAFKEYEIEPVPREYPQINPQAMPGPFEFPLEPAPTLSKEARLKRQERKIGAAGA